MKLIEKIFSWKEIQSSHRLMIFIVLFLGGLNYFWGEIVPAGGGFGWDGVRYANMVRNIDSMISEGQLSNYYAQRFLPSTIVRSMLILYGGPISDTNIIRGFELYNLVLLVGACWVWKRIADNFSLSLAGRWIGFSGIFVNFESSKQAFYYPVLTDVTALFVAMLLLLFYVEKKPIALFLATIIGAFCWPVVSICGAILIIFLGANLSKETITPVSSIISFKSFKLGSFMVGALLIVGYIILSQVMPPGVAFHAIERLLTALPSLVGMLVAIAMLIGSKYFFQEALAGLRRARLPVVVLAIAAVLVPFCIVKIISNPSVASESSLMLLIKFTLLPPEGKFLLPIVTLASFWGPVVVLLLLYWKAFCIEARKLGPGVVAVIGISLLLGLVGEPRFLTIGWPFFVLGLVLVMEASSTKVSFKYALGILTVVYAQFWMRFNVVPWLGPDYENLQEFPKQLYFMHYGLWMSWWSYFIQLILIVLSAIWLHKTVIKVEGS